MKSPSDYEKRIGAGMGNGRKEGFHLPYQIFHTDSEKGF